MPVYRRVRALVMFGKGTHHELSQEITQLEMRFDQLRRQNKTLSGQLAKLCSPVGIGCAGKTGESWPRPAASGPGITVVRTSGRREARSSGGALRDSLSTAPTL
jgi:hypothetical protein